jgi:hypothetical protein
VHQSGDRSRTGGLTKAGSRMLRWAAVEAAQHAWRPSNPWHLLYSDLAKRAGKNPAKVRRRAQDLDRRLARALPRRAVQARRIAPAPSCLGKLPLLSGRLTALHEIEKPRQLPRTLCEHPERRKRNEHSSVSGRDRPRASLPAAAVKHPTRRRARCRRYGGA